jgi:hypothetical protein
MHVEISDEPDHCQCGQQIFEHCYIRNRLTRSETYAGNVCINRFLTDLGSRFDFDPQATLGAAAKWLRACIFPPESAWPNGWDVLWTPHHVARPTTLALATHGLPDRGACCFLDSGSRALKRWYGAYRERHDRRRCAYGGSRSGTDRHRNGPRRPPR